LYVYATNDISQKAEAGVSGMEFVAIILLFTLVPAVALLVLVNLVGLSIYLLRRRPKGIGLAVGIVSLLVSFSLVSYTGYQAWFAPHASYEDYTTEATYPNRFEDGEVTTEATKSEAIEFIRNCDLNYVSYNDQARTYEEGAARGESSSTGFMVSVVDYDPYRLSIADKYIPEIVPIVREAQKKCILLKLWHDGDFEKKQPDGTWR
jgi:hypothetical protein